MHQTHQRPGHCTAKLTQFLLAMVAVGMLAYAVMYLMAMSRSFAPSAVLGL